MSRRTNPNFHYDFERHLPSDLYFIARCAVVITRYYLNVVDLYKPGFVLYDNMDCYFVTSRSGTPIKEGKFGIAISEKNWTIIERGLGRLYASLLSSRIAHEIAHSVLWRYYESGKLGVDLVHNYLRRDKPLVWLDDEVSSMKFQACDLDYIIKNKEELEV